MKAVLVVAWLMAVGASLWFAGSAWRGSKPFDTFRSYNPFGSDFERPRALVWAPAGMLGLFGAGMLRAIVLHTDHPPAAVIGFMIVWMGAATWMSWAIGRKLRRGRKGTPS
jgi:hypothetical protein